ncbi:M20 family metallopeptidase [Clostridium sp. SYSU_GA19001]|uniref:M20 family metallopeptidase n=1 Tax=Clostridium caldaquaticum TaxID=2940653 RepID=UPI00207741C9|nr:M20 family metallopeptidase [Clostridium caldaquaticum]MCM8711401.1 M20 family metallopeptidase [Clostridium caldaquaticum]
MDLKKIIKDKLPLISEAREKLHNNAELSYKEYNTQKILLDFLKNIKINAETMLETGVTATLNEEESCIAVRADMDALPVNGVSHACGHDYHMAVALGTALVLKEIGFKKCVKFIFQPAEEAEGGALPMIKKGVLKNPEVKYMIGFHVWPKIPVGKIEVSSGASMGSVDDFNITFKGIGGHAAMPHICKNPIFPAIDLIQSMTMKSRIENNPLNPHVITFSAINAGTANNVIPGEAKVLGTVRTFDNALRKSIEQDIRNSAELAAGKYGCEAIINYSFQYPPVISDIALTELFINASKKILGSENVLPLEKTFAAEDFAFFAEKVPSVHFRLGISDGIKGEHPLHSPYFDVSEDALYYGIYVTANFILSLEDKL